MPSEYACPVCGHDSDWNACIHLQHALLESLAISCSRLVERIDREAERGRSHRRTSAALKKAGHARTRMAELVEGVRP